MVPTPVLQNHELERACSHERTDVPLQSHACQRCHLIRPSILRALGWRRKDGLPHASQIFSLFSSGMASRIFCPFGLSRLPAMLFLPTVRVTTCRNDGNECTATELDSFESDGSWLMTSRFSVCVGATGVTFPGPCVLRNSLQSGEK